ncbi:hypothetical protein PIB30_074925 [Stylosanthes scabra]|uniref:Uncharacterized protein n=1 Tax=Stylosanthes scabra TaxID=79078 RepID=A0ABU6QPJ1_9FABA|nr:hypothetical protein [Stylosanthes scabra]
MWEACKYVDEKLAVKVVGVICIVLLLGSVAECREVDGILENLEYPAISCRKHSASLTDFGGVGDGKTSNTKAFQYAIGNLSHYGSDGGSLLVLHRFVFSKLLLTYLCFTSKTHVRLIQLFLSHTSLGKTLSNLHLFLNCNCN